MSSAVALNTRSRIRKREAVQEGSDDEGSDHRPRKVLVATMNDGHDSDSSEDVSLRRSQRTGLKMKFTRAGPGKGWAAVSQSEPNPQPSRDSRSQVEAGLRRSKRRTVLTSTPQTFSASLPAASTLQPEALATLAKVASREGQVQSPTDAALRWLDMPPSAVPKAPHRAQMTRQERARAREEIQRTKTVAKLSAQPTTSRKGLAGRGKSVSKKVNNSTLPSQLEIQDEEWIGISTGINKPQLGTSHSPSPAIPRASPLLQESARDPLDEHQLLNHVTPPPVRPILRQHKELGFHPHEKAHVHEAIRRKKVFERRKKVIEKPPQQSKLSRVQLAGRGHANRKRTSQLTKATASLKVDFESDEWAGIGETTLAASTTVVSLEEMEELNVEHMLLPSPTSQPRSPQLSDEQSLSTAELPRTKNGGEASNSNPINRFHSRASSDPAQSHSQDLSDVAKITDHISGGSPGFNNTLQVNLGRVQTSLTQASLHLDSQPSQSHAAIETGLDSGALPTSSKHPYSTNDYAEISTVHDHGSPSDISTYPPPRDNISAIEEARTLDHIKKIKTSNKLVSQPRFSSTRGSRPRQQQFARDNNNKEIAHPTALSPIPVAETDLGDLDPPQNLENSLSPQGFEGDRQRPRWQSPPSSREDLETLMREIESDENMTDAEDSAGDQAPIASKDDVWGTEVQLPLSSVEHTHKPGTSKQSSRKAVQAHDTQTEDLIKRCNAVLDRAEKVLPTFPTAAEGQYATANDFARKTQAHSTRSGAKMAPRPRRPAVNAARARMRKYINDKMSRSNLRAPPPFVPADQLMPNAGARFALKQEPITSKFNKLSVQLLVQSYISTRASDLPHDGDYREEVESYFFYYIGHIYSRAAKMEDERRCDEIKRAARHSQRKQKKIVRRMKAASETPAYRRHVPMVSQMGVQAMSSEDTLSEGEGFLIRGVPWLSEEATNMLHGLDDAETYLLRHSAKQRLKRLPRITGPPLEDRKLRLGLPPNAYDSAYLESRGQDSKPSDEMYDFSLDQSVRDSVEQRKSSKGKGRVR